MMEALAEGWTNTQNFGQYNIIPSGLFVAGHKNIKLSVESAQRVVKVNNREISQENIQQNKV